jgi:hypothetical protein
VRKYFRRENTNQTREGETEGRRLEMIFPARKGTIVED